jgi:TolB protein
MDADGGNPVNLTRESLSSEAFPQWSPDGSRIAYNSNLSGNQQIHIMNADGANRLQKTNEALMLSDARWSPDGGHILYAASRASRESIIVMDTVDFDPKVNLTLDLDSAATRSGRPTACIAFPGAPAAARSTMNAGNSGKINNQQPRGRRGAAVNADGSRILFLSNRDSDDDITR